MYDLAIIGAGWAGFNAAIRAKELGLKTVLIEKKQIGGTCLNLGCIPTKSLIQSAKILSLAKKAKGFGVSLSREPVIDFIEIQSRKNKLIQQLAKGMESILEEIDTFGGVQAPPFREEKECAALSINPKASTASRSCCRRIEFLNGTAVFLSVDTLSVDDKKITAKNILICTGSRPQELNSLKFDGKKVICSDDLLNIEKIPGKLLIIGGGVIGCEFADLFNTLGSSITLVELMPQLVPGIDPEVSKKLENIFQKKGIAVKTNTNAKDIGLKGFDLILVAAGRKPDFDSLNLDKIRVKTENNAIWVDDNLKTSVPEIYAAGDCTGKTMLAHFASFQGRQAIEIIAGKKQKDAATSAIPACVYTEPEIAYVGLSQEQAVNLGLKIEIKKFDFRGSGMARILNETEGFIKVIIEEGRDRILGACIIGPRAIELISVFTLAIDEQIPASKLQSMVFPHPSISESIADLLR